MLGVLAVVHILARKQNDGRLSKSQYAQAMLDLRGEIIQQNAFVPVSVNDALLRAALPFVAQHNLNATDAVVLRSAFNLQRIIEADGDALMLWTSDKRLSRAAQHEGMAVFDPESDTLERLDALLAMSN